MKKVVLSVLLLFPVFAFSQQIISEKKVVNLKDEVQMYTTVWVESSGFKIKVSAVTNRTGLCSFYDPETEKAKKFESEVEVFNFMHEHGWMYIDEQVHAGSAMSRKYLFKKKE